MPFEPKGKAEVGVVGVHRLRGDLRLVVRRDPVLVGVHDEGPELGVCDEPEVLAALLILHRLPEASVPAELPEVLLEVRLR